MGGAIGSLTKHANARRDDILGDFRTKSNHPERLSVSEIVITNDTKPKARSQSKTTSIQCSEFYVACRTNNIKQVKKKLLDGISLNEIDRLEPNGSTALHAACYHGHTEIVELLLKTGADRAISNKFDCLPFDEANNAQIKQLFFRVPTSNRLVSDAGTIEWELISKTVLETAAEERSLIKSIYDNASGFTPIDKMFEKIEKNYINEGLTNFDGIDDIKRFFEKATKEQDPIWIIKAYTAETDFYKVLNKEIAGGANKYQNERRYIIALLMYHPKLDSLSFTGTCYRVIQMNYHDLAKYQINCLFMTKSFLSSSIDQKVAELFLCQKESAQQQTTHPVRAKADGSLIKSWVMCVYNIKHRRTALHTENSSQYANEGEVLIMPSTVFIVKRIEQIKLSCLPKEQTMTQIDLDECDEYLHS
jgi:hypothetical protein